MNANENTALLATLRSVGNDTITCEVKRRKAVCRPRCTAEFPSHTLLDEEALRWLGELDGGPLTRSQMTALALLRKGATLNNSSYRASTGIRDSRTASRELRELVDRGIVEQIGSRGTATYRLVDADRTAEPDLFDASSAASELSSVERQVWALLEQGESSRSALEAATGIPGYQILRALQRLRDKGLVRMSGGPRSRNATWMANRRG